MSKPVRLDLDVLAVRAKLKFSGISYFADYMNRLIGQPIDRIGWDREEEFEVLTSVQSKVELNIEVREEM